MAEHLHGGAPCVTIGIKALNEEAHIADALASALRAVERLDGEVVLADSGSTDRTIEIARTFPVQIVQLADPAERSCGAGAQLAFQHARGSYFYMLDGDMVLNPDFIAVGIAFLEANPTIAGVGGLVQERNIVGDEFRIRARATEREGNWAPGEVDRLDCGGLYRVSALREAGYFADRNLHAFEEFELGARLRSLGWGLARINHHAIDHFGHTTSSYRLLWRRLKTGYSCAPGEVLRGAMGQRHLSLVLTDLAHIRHGLIVIAWWLLMVLSPVLPAFPWTTLLLLAGPILFLTARRGTFRLGLYSLAAWNISAIGLIRGLFSRRVPPDLALMSVELADPAKSPSTRATIQQPERSGSTGAAGGA